MVQKQDSDPVIRFLARGAAFASEESTLLAHTAAKESLHSCSGHFVALKERWGG